MDDITCGRTSPQILSFFFNFLLLIPNLFSHNVVNWEYKTRTTKRHIKWRLTTSNGKWSTAIEDGVSTTSKPEIGMDFCRIDGRLNGALLFIPLE